MNAVLSVLADVFNDSEGSDVLVILLIVLVILGIVYLVRRL